ncbi:hypothetical protein [Rodentibacter caecimuris]|uniref:DNA gyrase subunit B n=1 Tax=Rodentibacter caecimuris TaxID=1796644 RepID=A0ABX3KYR2_9PAST|nr:hypothetical protein BKG89_02795 [Rodentibacter heylii]
MIKVFTNFLLTLLSVAYPLLWWWQPNLYWLPYLPFGLAFLWLCKGLQGIGIQRFFAFLMAVVLFISGISRGLDLMYWYPVWVNSFMLILFGGSLWAKQTVVEKLARLQEPDLPVQAIAYTRKVTQVWCSVFIVNIVITSLLIGLNYLEAWALYSGVIAYVIMIIVMAGEWFIRPKYKKKNNE